MRDVATYDQGQEQDQQSKAGAMIEHGHVHGHRYGEMYASTRRLGDCFGVSKKRTTEQRQMHGHGYGHGYWYGHGHT